MLSHSPLASPPAPRRSQRLVALCAAAALLAAPALASLAAAPAASALTEPTTTGTAALPTDEAQALTASKAGDLVQIRIGDVHPTQPSLGFDEVYYKLGRYTMGKDSINKAYDDWCEANGQDSATTVPEGASLKYPASFTCKIALGAETKKSIANMKTVVVGPGGVPYLTDGHHTLTSLYELPGGGADLKLRLRVVENYSTLSDQDFWQKMVENKWTWLSRVDGTAITPAELPATVGLANFADDPNRSLLYFARDIGYTAGTIPFQEFYWGDWVRDTQRANLSGWNTSDLTSYLDAVRTVSEAQVALPADSVVARTFTAQELGALTSWNEGKAASKGEWNKLSQPFEAEKPGKLAYAMAYKATLPPTVTPVDPSTVFGAVTSAGELRAGAEITLTGAGFAPSTAGFKLELHSTPVLLGTVDTDDQGTFTAKVTLPAEATGDHRLVVLFDGVEVGSTPVSIAPAATQPGTPSAPGTNTEAAPGSGTETGAGTPAATQHTAKATPQGDIANTGLDTPELVLICGIAGATLMLAGVITISLRRRETATHDEA